MLNVTNDWCNIPASAWHRGIDVLKHCPFHNGTVQLYVDGLINQHLITDKVCPSHLWHIYVTHQGYPTIHLLSSSIFSPADLCFDLFRIKLYICAWCQEVATACWIHRIQPWHLFRQINFFLPSVIPAVLRVDHIGRIIKPWHLLYINMSDMLATTSHMSHPSLVLIWFSS